MNRLSDDDIALAGEAALGLLGPAEQAAASARMATDPAFADEVAAWHERLHPMASDASMPPPDAVWQGIQSQIIAQPQQDRGTTLWKRLTMLSTGIAAVLALMLFTQPTPSPEPTLTAPLIAALGSVEGRAAMTASYDRTTGELTLTPVSMETGTLYPELWIIPEGGTAASLGIVRGDVPSRIFVNPKHRAVMAKGATLAITPEPFGGAPGGKATGPILASGAITTI